VTSPSYKSVIAETIQLSSENIGKIFTIHILYTAIATAIFAPLTALVGRLLLRLSGKPMLSDFDIAWFIFSPAGMLALVFFSSLIVTILVFEQTSLMALLYGHLHKQQLSAIDALRFTVKYSRKIFFFALQLVLRLLLITLPFLVLSAAVAWFTITDYDINYYLTAKPPVFLITVSIIVVILLFMLQLLIKMLFKWSLTLPILLFSETPTNQLFQASSKQISGYKKDLFISLAIWAVLSFLLGFVILGLIHFLGSQLAPRFLESTSQLLVFLGFFVILMSGANFLITTCSTGAFSSLLMLFYNYKSNEIPADLTQAGEQGKAFNAPLLVIIVVVTAVVGLWGSFQLLQNFNSKGKIDIIAHRGAAGKAPENTMASFKQAINDNTDWIELDVQESIEGKIMVVHDSDFMKLAGVNKKVWDLSYEDMQDIDIGGWFDKKYSSERPPTLREVLELAKGKAKVLIELKYYGHTQQLEQRVAEIVEETGMTNDVALMSLKLDGIQTFHTIRPQWSTGLLTTKAIGDLSAMDFDFMAINMAAANPAFIRSIHNGGKDVYVWTVNDQISMFRMMSLGVDGIITDEPELAGSVREKFMALSTIQRLAFNAMVLFNTDIPEKIYRDDSP